jgi:hypothetical protein
MAGPVARWPLVLRPVKRERSRTSSEKKVTHSKRESSGMWSENAHGGRARKRSRTSSEKAEGSRARTLTDVERKKITNIKREEITNIKREERSRTSSEKARDVERESSGTSSEKARGHRARKLTGIRGGSGCRRPISGGSPREGARSEERAEQRLAAGGRRLPRPGRVASTQPRRLPRPGRVSSRMAITTQRRYRATRTCYRERKL